MPNPVSGPLYRFLKVRKNRFFGQDFGFRNLRMNPGYWHRTCTADHTLHFRPPVSIPGVWSVRLVEVGKKFNNTTGKGSIYLRDCINHVAWLICLPRWNWWKYCCINQFSKCLFFWWSRKRKSISWMMRIFLNIFFPLDFQ